jgi:hypothetical protein
MQPALLNTRTLLLKTAPFFSCKNSNLSTRTGYVSILRAAAPSDILFGSEGRNCYNILLLCHIIISPDCTAGRLADSSPATPAVHYGVLAVNKTDITRWCGFCSGLLVLSCSVTNMVGSQKFSVSVWCRNRLPSRCIHYFPKQNSSFL